MSRDDAQKACDGFERAIDASELAPGEATVAEVAGSEIAIVNLDGEFFALDNCCPHEEGPLGEGYVQGGALVCPLHYWEFDVRTGAYLDDATVCVKRYETRVEAGVVMVRVDR